MKKILLVLFSTTLVSVATAADGPMDFESRRTAQQLAVTPLKEVNQRVALIQYLQRVGSRKSILLLTNVLNDPAEGVSARRAAAQALAHYGDGVGSGSLYSFLRDFDPSTPKELIGDVISLLPEKVSPNVSRGLKAFNFPVILEKLRKNGDLHHNASAIKKIINNAIAAGDKGIAEPYGKLLTETELYLETEENVCEMADNVAKINPKQIGPIALKKFFELSSKYSYRLGVSCIGEMGMAVHTSGLTDALFPQALAKMKDPGNERARLTGVYSIYFYCFIAPKSPEVVSRCLETRSKLQELATSSQEFSEPVKRAADHAFKRINDRFALEEAPLGHGTK